MSAPATGPATDVLPDGFQVQIDQSCVRRRDLRYLVGGSPTRVLKLSDAALGMTSADGRIAVHDPATRSLARTLLDSGIGLPRPMGGPAHDSVTIVIPVRDNQAGIDTLLRARGATRMIVVDDGSATPIHAEGEGLTLIRLPENRGPAAARNAGLAAAATDFVAFLDSDTVPTRDWLTMLLGHFSDPKVAIVAPRIVGRRRPSGGSVVSRYANAHSSLDMGPREAMVASGTALAYVPSAAMVVRREGFLGFDESLRVAEDVDLCWRTQHAGWRVYYDPVAKVRHDHRESLSELLDRHRYYGTGAAELAARHGPVAAPVMSTVPMAAAVIGLLTRTRLGLLISAILALHSIYRTRNALEGVPGREMMAAGFVGRGLAFGLLQAAQALLRHYWPVTLVVSLFWSRFRNLVWQLAIAEGIATWVRVQLLESRAPAMGPVGFLLMHRLDDLAYGTGLWQGVVKQASPSALRPMLRL
ncbi:mycofactocin biosynthesis glycosyltransferase MftF [Gordonia sp. (in: high G+C Gram-positive bacteria)]|uniref:mycofactocin biosynthesis glycosyltransferase MftF n=1 Tax=unclassified Gordonia (in: high G+C Gram-positive bacteria) TaxID=2657482 RepID=UPI002637BACA|nr:mycofactocin biosynthesis glycosyltransferase MftF [Gordonia sp. (in: high G+C Gram-positive bacteria)]